MNSIINCFYNAKSKGKNEQVGLDCCSLSSSLLRLCDKSQVKRSVNVSLWP